MFSIAWPGWSARLVSWARVSGHPYTLFACRDCWSYCADLWSLNLPASWHWAPAVTMGHPGAWIGKIGEAPGQHGCSMWGTFFGASIACGELHTNLWGDKIAGERWWPKKDVRCHSTGYSRGKPWSHSVGGHRRFGYPCFQRCAIQLLQWCWVGKLVRAMFWWRNSWPRCWPTTDTN